ncbi:HPr(Ser) kinase/phosphatase [Spiroplasma alleghenense]|uniref:HPr kinase/phosphorylase n=1 Tax=Spiroplasma alleghenense TaxID=216931 RepID=A0A345Z2B8_9MOLU|nr:HPr(Ser) kinase/phosphatase [Spiroplasma alleghenense]AXK50747.1 HPr kinase/phosphorylase [Spiroplasma alleghenense]
MFYIFTTLGAAMGILIFFLLALWIEKWNFRRLTIKVIAILSLLTAMSVVLTNFISYSFPFFGGAIILALGDWIIFLTGMTFGPLSGVIVGICTDLTGTMINLSGQFHLGFMMIKVLLGFSGSLVFLFRKNNFIYLKVLLIYSICYTLTSLVLNPIWLYAIGWGNAVFVHFVAKLIKLPFGIAVYPLIAFLSFTVIVKIIKDWSENEVWCFRRGKINFFGKIMLKRKLSLKKGEVKMNKLKIKNLVDHFELEVISGKEHLDNVIEVYGLNRAGLELAGYVEKDVQKRRVVLFSNKENNYIHGFTEAEREKKYLEMLKDKIPAVIITEKFDDNILVKTTNKLGIPLLKVSGQTTSEFTQQILGFYDDYFAPSEEFHGSLVNIYGKGVMIMGKSGIGKSEITIELVKKNHLFVGDDRIVAIRKSSKIYGKSHEILNNLVEVRGIGIVDIAQTNGYQVILDETEIELVIDLIKFGENGVDDTDRLGNEYDTKNILGVKIPHIRIPVSSGRNIANIIETAVAQLKIKESGNWVSPTKIIANRIEKTNQND